MKRSSSVSLNRSYEIENLMKALDDYKSELTDKAQVFVSRLIDRGIEVAEQNTGEYKGYILFTRELTITDDGCVGLLIGNGKVIVKEWYTDKKRTHKRSYPINPLLLAEFGSGWLAKNIDNIPGVGQGTMPRSYGHAFDTNGWWWYDENGTKHHSIGESPTYPMHTASLAMLFDIDRIGKEVFGNG